MATTYKNLLESFPDTLQVMDDHVAKTVFYSVLGTKFKQLVDDLNKAYDTVFWCHWVVGNPCDKVRNGELLVDGYDSHDQDDYVNFDEPDTNMNEEPYGEMSEVYIKLLYQVTKKCDLGHRHRYTRFRFFSIARAMEMINDYRIHPVLQDIVKKHIPDVF
jgi:hypothetical protein